MRLALTKQNVDKRDKVAPIGSNSVILISLRRHYPEQVLWVFSQPPMGTPDIGGDFIIVLLEKQGA
jgi:hypothetical protein